MSKSANQSREKWGNAFIIIIPYLLIGALLLYSFSYVPGLEFLRETGREKSDWERLIQQVALTAAAFSTVIIFRRYLDKASFASLGLSRILMKDVLLGLLSGAVMIAAGFAFLLGLDEIQYVSSHMEWDKFLLSLVTFVLVAIAEELVIRGYMLSNLMAAMNKYYALIISSVAFSLFHSPSANYGLLPALELFLAGMLLGLSYIYTRNLSFPIALHFSWNFFQGTVFGFNVSGTNSFSIVEQARGSDTLLNGGQFGFEGSIVSVVLHLIFIGLVYLVFRRRTMLDV